MGKFEDVNDGVYELINTIVKDFLREHGGFQNGLDTWVDGIINEFGVGCIDWSTPSIQDMTMSEHRGLGNKLFLKIQSLFTKDFLREHVIKLKKPKGNGNYFAKLIIYKKYKINGYQ